MINEIRIKNYKSIQKMIINPGQMTVLIGENGSGKTNILEVLALASAAANDKLDNEFLTSRGIRVTDPKFMRAAFHTENISDDIFIQLKGGDDSTIKFQLQNDNMPYSKWTLRNKGKIFDDKVINAKLKHYYDHLSISDFKGKKRVNIADILNKIVKIENIKEINIKNFLVYSPQNSLLREFEKKGQIEPLGIKGEGLFKLLQVFCLEKNQEKLNIIKEKLKVINWFEDFEIPKDLSEGQRLIQIKDKYLHEMMSFFDQYASNEGFLLLLFYYSLFVSEQTPDFFAIDNIDASLNPKLCRHLMKELVQLAKQYNKQAILTTHNAALLDGLNLNDPNQKLYVVFRNKQGYTKIRQIEKPESKDMEPVRLSEAFLRGYIGGLPKGF
jgi:predicted ATPase